MDDPDVAWPFWKFGLKSEDLFTTLHAQYNTVPSAIQDPEAFHHDVYEISTEASTTDEFYRLMADRKAMRLRELNDLLESASLEIIANPSLIGTEQWQHAVQLFRTRSLDSLVRYFASYLPDSHPWHRRDSVSDDADSISGDSVARSHASSSFFDDGVEDKPILKNEPLCLTTVTPQLPPSPRSMTMSSDSPAPSAAFEEAAHRQYVLDNLTPARTLSFSESESDRFAPLKDSCPSLHVDEDALHPSDPETPSTSVSDLSELAADEIASEFDKDMVVVEDDEAIYHGFVAIAARTHEVAVVAEDLETPTPKPDAKAGATPFFEAELSSIRCRNLSPSPQEPHCPPPVTVHHDCRKPPRSPRLRRRDLSPDCARRRRSPADGRIRKPLPTDQARLRPRGRRQVDS